MKKIFGLCAAIFFVGLAADEFTTDFADRGSLSGTTAKFLSVERLNFVPGSGGGESKALLLRRGASWPRIELTSPLTAEEDFGYAFDITRLDDSSSVCFGFDNGKDQYTGMIFIDQSGTINIRKTNPRYVKTSLKLEPRKKYRISVAICRDAETVTVAVSELGRHQEEAVFYPGLKFFGFAPQDPKDTRCAIENFELYRRSGRIVRRENGVRNAKVELSDPEKKVENLSLITDGRLDESVPIPEKSVLLFHLPRRIDAVAVQIFGGNPAYRNYPSGACAPRNYVVEGLSNGAWTVLAEGKNVPDAAASKSLLPEDRFVRHDFAPVTVDQIRIRFSESYDTGKRTTGRVAPEDRAIHLREVEIFTAKKMDKELNIGDLLQMEYRLPVYRNAQQAVLTLVAAANPQTPTSGTLTIADPAGRTIRTGKVNLTPGRNSCIVENIGELPAGRYMTTLATARGELKRLLRIERVPEVAPAAEPLRMAGKKIFFTPDDFVLSKSDKLAVTVFPPKMHELVRTPSEDKLLLHGTHFYQAKDGRYIIGVNDVDYRDGALFANRTQRILAADKLTGPYEVIAAFPEAKKKVSPFRDFCRAPFPKAPAGTRFEFYDPARHGVMPLGNLSYIYNYQPMDYGCVKAPARTYWITGRTSDGKWVMMRDKPLFTDVMQYGADDFDNGFMTNDNFGGMWLSPDGRECFWAQGQTMKRSAPYALAYDNLQTGVRIMTVYSTKDGVDWRLRSSLTVPDENDSEGAQHYGVMLQPIADGDLLLGYLYAYDSTAQQIYIELVYSRDCVNFHRFPGSPPFVRGTVPDEWYFGHVFANRNIIREGDFYYQQAGYCTSIAHFACEVIFTAKNLREVTAEKFQQRFEDRDLARKWPYFRKVGGYEGLAELSHRAYYAAGAMQYRVDGWFGLKADDEVGTFETRRITGSGTLCANAEILSGGMIEIELRDTAGKLLKKGSVTGNGVRQPLFELPESGEYRLVGRMKNAVLYTLNFTTKSE